MPRYSRYLHQSSGIHEYVSEQKRDGEDVLWIPGSANLIKRVNQSVLSVGPECHVKVNSDADWWGTRTLLVLRDVAPRVFRAHVVPMW